MKYQNEATIRLVKVLCGSLRRKSMERNTNRNRITPCCLHSIAAAVHKPARASFQLLDFSKYVIIARRAPAEKNAIYPFGHGSALSGWMIVCKIIAIATYG